MNEEENQNPKVYSEQEQRTIVKIAGWIKAKKIREMEAYLNEQDDIKRIELKTIFPLLNEN
jgi:hypothetical protein